MRVMLSKHTSHNTQGDRRFETANFCDPQNFRVIPSLEFLQPLVSGFFHCGIAAAQAVCILLLYAYHSIMHYTLL